MASPMASLVLVCKIPDKPRFFKKVNLKKKKTLQSKNIPIRNDK